MFPFMRKISSLKALKAEGTDPEFFRAGEAIPIPRSLTSPISTWCRDAQVANTTLPSKGAQHDDPLDVFYVSLATRKGQSEMQQMLKSVAEPLMNAIKASACSIDRNSIFTADANGPVDEMSALGDFRNLLMACAIKPSKAEGDDVTLIIFV